MGQRKLVGEARRGGATFPFQAVWRVGRDRDAVSIGAILKSSRFEFLHRPRTISMSCTNRGWLRRLSKNGSFRSE